MKKLFFSAVALVAFSFAGMANTIAVEEDSQVDNKKIEKIETGTPCADGASFVLHFLMEEMNLTFSQAWRLSEIGFQHCMRNTYGSN
ncbi:hypothetical protein WFZ85_10415 [Flavobacterium sp. j3]|uniref:Uncharacterized protein n=1 Tax=Flavobacterium aureirubrum TaxID=3133147 RepID=A0ABU9N914_9FLAO